MNSNPLKHTNIRRIDTKKLLVALSLILVVFSVPLVTRGQEASFYITPKSGSYEIGKTFNVTVFINSEGVSINATQAKMSFPSGILKVVNISKSNSIFPLWVQEPVWSNSKGEISFGGGLPSPGFKGKAGKVMTIFFQGKSPGEALVDFRNETILENSPYAPDIFSFSQEGKYSIFKIKPPEIPKVPSIPQISSPTHPKPEEWYSNSNPEFQWKIESDIIGISFAFNQKSIFSPDDISEEILSSKTFEGVEDGIWYFHLKVKNDRGWSKTAHFKVQIDTYPPRPFEIVVDNEGDPTNPYPLLYFETKDDTSGISHYEIEIGKGDILRVFEAETNPFRMPYQAPGIRPVIVRAKDFAQNFTESKTEVKVESIPPPEITVCPSVFVSGEEIMYIEGTALPDCEVIVFFKRDEELIKKWRVPSNKEGEWFLKEEGLFRSGMYEVSAKTKDSRGAISNPSKSCFVKVILVGIALGPWIISYDSLILFFLIILAIILIGIFYLLWRMRKTREEIKKESKDLKNKFYKEFYELQEDIKKELKTLKWLRPEHKMTKKEKEREKELLKNLADVKRVFEKELEDIEEIK